MTVTTYTSNGTPSDALGAQGDMCVDYGGKFLWGPKGASSWSGTANSIVGPTGPGAYPKQHIFMGTHYRSATQNGIVRAAMLCLQGTTVGTIPANVMMPSAGYVSGLTIYVGYTTGTQQAISLEVFKNNAAGIAGQIIDVAAVTAGATAPSSPITFPAGQYTFSAGDTLGMGINSGSNVFACSVGMFVTFTG